MDDNNHDRARSLSNEAVRNLLRPEDGGLNCANTDLDDMIAELTQNPLLAEENDKGQLQRGALEDSRPPSKDGGGPRGILKNSNPNRSLDFSRSLDDGRLMPNSNDKEEIATSSHNHSDRGLRMNNEPPAGSSSKNEMTNFSREKMKEIFLRQKLRKDLSEEDTERVISILTKDGDDSMVSLHFVIFWLETPRRSTLRALVPEFFASACSKSLHNLTDLLISCPFKPFCPHNLITSHVVFSPPTI